MFDLTGLSGDGGDGGGVTGETAVKSVAAIRDCVSTFDSAQALTFFKEASGQFPDMFVRTKR